jgi:hypothetical protein
VLHINLKLERLANVKDFSLLHPFVNLKEKQSLAEIVPGLLTQALALLAKIKLDR